VAAIEDRRERGPALGRLRPALGRLRPSRQTLVALAVVAAVVAVVMTVAWESDVERPAAAPGKKVVATDVERGVRFSLDGRVLTVQLVPPVRKQTFEAVSGAEISAACGANVAAPPVIRGRDDAHPALAGRPDEPELPLPARRLDLVPAPRRDRQHRRAGELARRVSGASADRRDHQQVGAALLQLSDLYRLHSRTACYQLVRDTDARIGFAVLALASGLRGATVRESPPLAATERPPRSRTTRSSSCDVSRRARG
jgi:hypothetical protein